MEIGIDEAGRGPVIGSVFVAGVANFKGLAELGVKDSKVLSPAKREYLASRIEESTDFYVVEMTAREIDEQRKRRTLNEIMVELFAQVLIHFRPDRAFVDAADVKPERFAANLRSNCAGEGAERIEIISEWKADVRYPLVSAASIIAKVHRDRSIRELEAELGAEIGSGYPADPKTIQFLKELLKEGEMKDLPRYVRQSWRTIDLYIPKG
jgi:ribonuclease HII